MNIDLLVGEINNTFPCILFVIWHQNGRKLIEEKGPVISHELNYLSTNMIWSIKVFSWGFPGFFPFFAHICEVESNCLIRMQNFIKNIAKSNR